ncbi:MAG TPA: AAA family ATPase [Longimicrobiaceae bacterium]|nr:AAA family ATPase [Longimicrobiaceae bacterium]
MYIDRLSISNLRSFRQAEVGFCYTGCEDSPPVANVTLLLGDNGAGKTSVLRAIALAALAPVIESSGFRPYRLVRRTDMDAPSEAVVRGDFLLHAQDTEHKERDWSEPAHTEARVIRRGDIEQIKSLDADTRWDGIFQETSPAFLVVGYGASRRVESGSSVDPSLREKSRTVRYQRVSGLFEEHVTLTPLGTWLPSMRHSNPGRHKQVINLINRLLPEGTRILDEPEGSEYVFDHQGAPVPFAAMSDGYRAYTGWIADLLYHVCMGAPSGYKLEENRGIVLVDEIDLHLHPAWQRIVVPQLAQALPNLQFVLTSHSPLVVGTLQSTNLRVIESDEGASTVARLHEHVHGRTADQILVSSYFGLSSPRAPAAVDELQGLSARAQEGDLAAASEFLSRLSASAFTAEERAAVSASGRGGTRARGKRSGGSPAS